MKGAGPKTSLKKESKLEARRFFWRKLTAAKWGDAWVERLTFLGPQRVMLIEFPNAPKVRVEAHGLTQKEADLLVERFGGKVSEAKWPAVTEPQKRPPINVRGRLLVVSTEQELREYEQSGSKTRAILVPAGMAFGTGEHATTAMCLRFLADISKGLPPGKWEALDLGTGSGILAIGARIFGASAVLGTDYDPHAVRTAKENVAVNGLKKIRMARLDVTKWEPDREWEVVMANLFSGLLIQVAGKIAKAIAPGGRLIFSGVLREQEQEVVEAFRKQKLEIVRILRKGKWISGLAARPA